MEPVEVEEILLLHLGLVAQAGRTREPVGGVDLHDVPQDRPVADLDHRLRPDGGLLRSREPMPPARMTAFMVQTMEKRSQ